MMMIHATSELATDMVVFVWNWSHRIWGDCVTPLVASSFVLFYFYAAGALENDDSC